MKTNKIYNYVFRESQLLNNLLSLGNLLFIGEDESITYLQNFTIQNKILQSNYFYSWTSNKQQEFLSKLQSITQCQGIIIASTTNESIIFNNISTVIAKTNLDIPILKLFDDIFVNFMAQTNLLQSSNCHFKKPTISYGILSLPRSGSTFLCQLLYATKIAGYPTEHFRTPVVALSKHCNFNYIRLLSILMTHKVTTNGVFGTKLISHFLHDFETAGNGFDNFFTAIDKYIYLVRKDELSQAISILLAQKTTVWHINTENNLLKYYENLGAITIDDELLKEIHDKLHFIRQQQEYIDKVIKKYQISPLIIKYEELVDNVEDNINIILKYLGINVTQTTITNLKYSIKKMGSELSLKIAEDYRKKYGIE